MIWANTLDPNATADFRSTRHSTALLPAQSSRHTALFVHVLDPNDRSLSRRQHLTRLYHSLGEQPLIRFSNQSIRAVNSFIELSLLAGGTCGGAGASDASSCELTKPASELAGYHPMAFNETLGAWMLRVTTAVSADTVIAFLRSQGTVVGGCSVASPARQLLSVQIPRPLCCDAGLQVRA